MTLNVLVKKGEFQFQEALEKMDWDTEKFESELEIYAKTQSPKVQERLRKDYNKFMTRCGWPMQLVEVDEHDGVKVRIPKVKPKPELTVTPQTEPTATTTETPQVAEETSQVPEPAPRAEPAATAEQTPETLQEQPQTEAPKAVTSAEAEFSVSDANLLKKLFEAINRVTDEPTIHMDSDALWIRQMNSGREAMIDYRIPKEFFEEYHVKTPGKYCFNMPEVLKVAFGKFKKDTPVTVKIHDYGRISFAFREGRVRERSFLLLDSSEEDVPTPKIGFNVKAKVIVKTWTEDLEDLAKVSDHMTITATNDVLTVKAEGDSSRGENKYKKGSKQLIDIEVREDSKAVYSLTKLNEILKIDPTFCDLAMVEFTSDMPMRLTMQTKFGELYSYLAPRIESE